MNVTLDIVCPDNDDSCAHCMFLIFLTRLSLANFAGDEFMDSTIAFDNGTVIALVHTEYPGNVYDNCDGMGFVIILS